MDCIRPRWCVLSVAAEIGTLEASDLEVLLTTGSSTVAGCPGRACPSPTWPFHVGGAGGWCMGSMLAGAEPGSGPELNERLVGSARERRLLGGLIGSVEGGGAAVLIVGEAGAGKTALLGHTAETASTDWRRAPERWECSPAPRASSRWRSGPGAARLRNSPKTQHALFVVATDAVSGGRHTVAALAALRLSLDTEWPGLFVCAQACYNRIGGCWWTRGPLDGKPS
jgi:hypothetical protein